MEGPEGSPYEHGVFRVHVSIPDRYPFVPPSVVFRTPVYHPNVDREGRICLDVLKMPPKGAWKPSLTVSSTLTTIRYLLADPNPDDPLSMDIVSDRVTPTDEGRQMK